ncbi:MULTISPECIES: hypothetical protein [unclassified Rhizobium]|uniref:hypothetical protein n=1 Tax=unclassified Rhizobium TaxID=2613769 RepID=UPI001AECC56B|nr:MULTISPECIES: hypothetical protein [unclassified Rhizobium]QYA15643.1 hypothetical protein J5284_21850 [Rhizobium sp. AB2/73]UEQ83490.1 hypothetical protein I8E17_25300 [Rhizobium sp. AB2/73]
MKSIDRFVKDWQRFSNRSCRKIPCAATSNMIEVIKILGRGDARNEGGQFRWIPLNHYEILISSRIAPNGTAMRVEPFLRDSQLSRLEREDVFPIEGYHSRSSGEVSPS